jgi:hypothetical protein
VPPSDDEKDSTARAADLEAKSLKLKKLIEEAERVRREIEAHLKRLRRAGQPDHTGEPTFKKKR